MKEILLIKTGELVLKGLNRSNFETALIKNIRKSINSLGKVSVKSAQSTIYIEPLEETFPFDEAIKRVEKIFGIAAYSRAGVCNKDIKEILKMLPEYLGSTMRSVKSFKVEAKRSDKKFPLTSPEISREAGAVLLSAFPHLKVDVHNPETVVTVEIRESAAYIRAGQIRGAGGLPVGTGGKSTILISGGIDSPVAAYMMSKRGLTLDAVHFASPPYTGPMAELKVKTLLQKVAAYSGNIRLAVVHFTEIQEQIADNCPEELFTLIMRRMMMRIACKISEANNSKALITGESLGQVASQTVQALAVTDAVCTMPVLRPLIGMDKEEIIKISRKIDAFETSVLPYEDCCTVFTPKHPKTRPELSQCEEAEKLLDIDTLINNALKNTVFSVIEQEEC